MVIKFRLASIALLSLAACNRDGLPRPDDAFQPDMPGATDLSRPPDLSRPYVRPCSQTNPENWWEGGWCYSSGPSGDDTVAAFQLCGDKASLGRDGYHPGTVVRLFDDNRVEAVAQVVWGERGPESFRLRFYQPHGGPWPDFSFVNPTTVEGSYANIAGVAVFDKADDLGSCP